MKSNIAYLPAHQERAFAADVDALGALEARIERLTEQAEVYRVKLKAALPTGNVRVSGNHFVCTAYDAHAPDKIDRNGLYKIVSRWKLERRGIVQDGAAYRCLAVKPKKSAVAAA